MGETFIHESSYIDEGVYIGQGTRIWHFCHVLANTRIGETCSIGQNVMIGPDVDIGRGCKIQNNVSVYQGVNLEDYVFCGPSVVFTNIYNPRAHLNKMDQVLSTLVREGATLGANSTIICGNRIGRFAMIGAGSVVNRDVEDYELVVGNPCRRIGWVCECGVKLGDDFRCTACGQFYDDVIV